MRVTKTLFQYILSEAGSNQGEGMGGVSTAGKDIHQICCMCSSKGKNVPFVIHVQQLEQP